MNFSYPAMNRRVLAVDDNPTIHEDFRKILSKAVAVADQYDDLETALFEAKNQPEVF